MFGNVTALEVLHVPGKYRDISMQHTCSRHAAWDPHIEKKMYESWAVFSGEHCQTTKSPSLGYPRPVLGAVAIFFWRLWPTVDIIAEN